MRENGFGDKVLEKGDILVVFVVFDVCDAPGIVSNEGCNATNLWSVFCDHTYKNGKRKDRQQQSIKLCEKGILKKGFGRETANRFPNLSAIEPFLVLKHDISRCRQNCLYHYHLPVSVCAVIVTMMMMCLFHQQYGLSLEHAKRYSFMLSLSVYSCPDIIVP